MVEVEKTSMGHERAPRDGWKRQYGISHSVTTIELMAQRVLEDLITAQLEIHTARIVVEILQKYVPETFGWTTTMT
jgi:hypothetical protein